MNINYHKLLLEELENMKSKKRLLLHSCCGPCSTYVISFLSDYFDITVIYYNPNIEPESEYLKRKDEQIKFIKNYKSKNNLDLLDIEYENDKFKNIIKGLESKLEGGSRCSKCFKLRLEKTASIASLNNYDYFGTTLTVSPHKNANIINEIGKSLEKEYNIKWLIADFKKNEGYKKSIILSKQYDLYRQDYCGCTSSKKT